MTQEELILIAALSLGGLGFVLFAVCFIVLLLTGLFEILKGRRNG